MNQQIETANKFIDVMCAAENRLSGIKEKIDTNKLNIQNIIENFSKEQKIIIDGVQHEIKAEGAKKIFESYKNVLTEQIEANKNNYAEYIKGTEFINKFEETFIVSVFGKVKSGKSYLGNYIMGTSFKKNQIQTHYNKLGEIAVNVYDRGKLSTTSFLNENIDESEGEGFGVASTEATSTIQYFKIGGLTWFDTPGIGSITKENEELAEEYIKNSDLVIFAMNSDAAGTQQEISELKSLYEMNKPMLLLITQSDTNEFDIDEDGEMKSICIAKSEKDRRDVEDYIIHTIKEKGMEKALELSGGKVLTISTKLAIEALKDKNSNLYEDSNLELFINRLIEITEGEAANLKERNPKDRFNKLIAELLESINDFDEEIKRINQDAKSINEKAIHVKEKVIGNVRYQALGIIHDNIAKASSESKSLGGGKISGKIIVDQVSAEINKIIKNECLASMKELVPDINLKLNNEVMHGEGVDVADLGDKKVTSSYEIQVSRRKKESRGMFGKITNWFFGEKYRTVTNTETRTIEFNVGNNAASIEEQLVSYFESICDTVLNDMIKDIMDACIKPFDIIYKGFTKLTTDTKKELENLKIK